MDLTRFSRAIRKSWYLIAALAVIGAVTGAVVAFLTPPTYSSSVRLFVSVQAPQSATAGDLVQANYFAVAKVYSYVEVVTTSVVLQPVIDELGLDETVDDLADDVSASVALNSVVLSISADAATPEDAATLATAVSESFSDYVVNTLESPEGGGPGPLRIETLQPAVAPDRAASPSTVANVAVGLFAGLVVGFALSLFLALRDRRVHGRPDLAELGVAYLAGVPRSAGRRADDLVVLRDAPDSPEAEAYRRLRTRLALTTDRTGETIAALSSIGAEGASTAAANLALAYAEGGAAVALIDADARHGRQTRLLRRDAANPARSIAVPGDVALVALRPGAGPADMREAVQTLRDAAFDIVILDAPPVLRSDEALVVADAADRCLLVVGGGRVDVSQVAGSLSALRGVGAAVEGVVITRLPVGGVDGDPAVLAPDGDRTAAGARRSPSPQALDVRRGSAVGPVRAQDRRG